jgi:hypothetical protein
MPVASSIEYQVPLRVIVLRPPTGVHYCLQNRDSHLIDIVDSSGADLSFNLTVRAQPATGGAVRFLGPFAHGPVSARFVYLCCGTSAGQHDSCWTRRVKVQLSGITWSLVEQAMAKPNGVLETRFEGTARDGGPSCATVRLLDGWQLK